MNQIDGALVAAKRGLRLIIAESGLTEEKFAALFGRGPGTLRKHLDETDPAFLTSSHKRAIYAADKQIGRRVQELCTAYETWGEMVAARVVDGEVTFTAWESELCQSQIADMQEDAAEVEAMSDGVVTPSEHGKVLQLRERADRERREKRAALDAQAAFSQSMKVAK